MVRFGKALLCIFVLCWAMVGSAMAESSKINVDVAHPGAKVSPILYGLMTEEINHSYDGGLYAELIQNRIFKDNATTPVHWSIIQSNGATGSIALDDANPVNNTALTTDLRLNVTSVPKGGRVGVANDGYWGIPVMPNTVYHASFYAMSAPGFKGKLTVDIESNDGSKVYATAKVDSVDTFWHHYKVTLRTGDVPTCADNHFVISTNSQGTLWFNLVSLFPPTYNNRPNGNRPDLMKLLAAMHPSFLRFPGGNYLEGNSIKERFNWEKTIGPIADRVGHYSPWGYRSTDGMGLLEFLEWCEDLHMEPLLAVYAGYSLNGSFVQPGKDLEPYVQSALDEIQYVTGSVQTKWGAERAKDGHPKPFTLHFVEIGNEDGFDGSHSYDARFAQFYDAIKAKYPQLQIIATAQIKSRVPDLVDDHYYRSALAMEMDSAHYDSYPVGKPQIFVGEWASTEGSPTPTMNAALGDASWLTGLERDSNKVLMASYAPLLVNVDPGASQWGTNLIGYNALTCFGSPSYYVQVMFGQNKGDRVLNETISSSGASKQKNTAPEGAIGVGTWNTQAEYKDIRVIADGKTIYQSDFANGTQGWKFNAPDWKADNGVLQQSQIRMDCRAVTGDPHWMNYTYELKARKIGGMEGFLILFHVKNAQNWIWWNIGGWNNSHTGLERMWNGQKSEFGETSPVTVETGKWYDIKIELQGDTIRCFLDGKLITSAIEPPAPQARVIYSDATLDNKTGDVIIKLVNTSSTPQSVTISLQGVKRVDSIAKGEILSGQPDEVNTINDPKRVSPKPLVIDNVTPTFKHTFQAYSVSVFRIRTR